MSDRDEREKRTIILKKFDDVVEIIKNALVLAGQGAIVKMKPNGNIVLIQLGTLDKTLLKYKDEEFLNTPYKNFIAYTHHVISTESEVVYDPKKDQIWKVAFDEATLIFNSSAENQTINIVIER